MRLQAADFVYMCLVSRSWDAHIEDTHSSAGVLRSAIQAAVPPQSCSVAHSKSLLS